MMHMPNGSVIHCIALHADFMYRDTHTHSYDCLKCLIILLLNKKYSAEVILEQENWLFGQLKCHKLCLLSADNLKPHCSVLAEDNLHCAHTRIQNLCMLL